jgi:hypothetical protein
MDCPAALRGELAHPVDAAQPARWLAWRQPRLGRKAHPDPAMAGATVAVRLRRWPGRERRARWMASPTGSGDRLSAL